jgi:hypothetical protein
MLAPVSYGGLEASFAKLQDENSSYIMHDYSIILGRNSEKSEVDPNLLDFGAIIQNVSHHHARIFYDFENHHFALKVLGRHGCMIQGVTYPPGSDPVKLNSQDLIEIQGAKMYFLLPTCSIYATIAAPRSAPLQGPNHSDSRKKVNPNMQGKLNRGAKSNISNNYAITTDLIGASGECGKQSITHLSSIPISFMFSCILSSNIKYMSLSMLDCLYV